MKRTFLSALAFVALSTVAHAGTLNLDLRGDYSSMTYDAPTPRDSSRFYLRTGRLDYQGKVFEDVSFRVRLAFTKSTTPNITDGVHPAAEFAYLSQKFNDTFSLTAGRMNTDIGGFEGNTSGSDLYMLSPAYSSSGAAGSFAGVAGSNAATYGSSSMLYMTGVKLTSTFMEGQSLQLMAMNEKNDETSSPTDQNSSLLGAVYKGAFFEKTLNFILSYHTMNGPVTDNKYQWMAAGAMWSTDTFGISVDYLLNDHKQDQPAVAKDEVNSLVVKAAYTGIEKWVPRLEFFSGERKTEITSATKTTYTGYGAVVEYRPYNDKNFRYHIAYNNIKDSPDGGTDLVRQEVIVGTRLLADFLK